MLELSQSERLGRASESRDSGSGSDVVSLHNLRNKLESSHHSVY